MAKYSYITASGEVREMETDNAIVDSLRAATQALQNKRQLDIQAKQAYAQAGLLDTQAALNQQKIYAYGVGTEQAIKSYGNAQEQEEARVNEERASREHTKRKILFENYQLKEGYDPDEYDVLLEELFKMSDQYGAE